jgi:hypothetical protein
MIAEVKRIDSATVRPMLVPELISLDELAARWQISAKKLRRACGARHSDPLPCIRIGYTVRFNLNDPRLAEWLERRTAGAAK